MLTIYSNINLLALASQGDDVLVNAQPASVQPDSEPSPPAKHVHHHEAFFIGDDETVEVDCSDACSKDLGQINLLAKFTDNWIGQ